MKKFLVMACIAAASMIALPAVAQTTTGSKTQTECCKKGKADCKKECNCTDCKCKDCKATAPCCDSKAKCTTRLIAANKPNAIRLRLLAAKRRM